MRKLICTAALVFLHFFSFSQNWSALYQESDSLMNEGEFEKALPLAEKAAAIAKSTYGEHDSTYAQCQHLLGQLYISFGDYRKAESILVETIANFRLLFGNESADLAYCLSDLGYVYRQLGQFEKAEGIVIEAMNMNRKILGENSERYSNDLVTLGLLYRSMGFPEKAEKLYLEAQRIIKTVKGEINSDYSNILNNLGVLYRGMGLFERSEQCLLAGVEIDKQTLGTNNPEYARTLIALGQLYVSTGRYDKSEPYYLEALAIMGRTAGEEHTHYSAILNNLGALYQKLGLYDKAEAYFLRALPIDRKLLGKDHPDYAQTVNNLGYFYQTTGKLAKAEPLYEEARLIYKKSMGENHPYYAQSLNNLAVLYAQTGRYEKAEAYYANAILIRKKSLGENNPEYATALHTFGGYYMRRGMYAKAEPLIVQAMEIRKKILDIDHPDFAFSLSRLSELYSRQGKYAKAEPFIKSYTSAGINNLIQSFSILSEKEKNDFIRNKIRLIDQNNSFLYRYDHAGEALYTDNFNLGVLLKSLVLADTRNVLASLRNNSDSSVQSLFASWQRNKNLLARQYALPVAKRRKDLPRMEEETESIEKELTRASSQFRGQQEYSRVKMQQIQESLEADEALIEFVSFTLDNYSPTRPDSILYAAYVLRKDGNAPRFIPLFEEKQLQDAWGKNNLSATALAKLVYNNPLDSAGQHLYKLIWQPLEKALTGIRKIAYSPAGRLYNIPIYALPSGAGGNLLLDKYEFRQYSSSRQLVLRKESAEKEKPASIVLMGNPAFNMDSTQLAEHRKKPEEKVAGSFLAMTTRAGDGRDWPDLKGTAEEVEAIGKLFSGHHISTVNYLGADASEDNLKGLDGHSPDVLHIATHGFFLPAPAKKKTVNLNLSESNPYIMAEDPLLRSGLALAGANYAWRGKAPVEGVEDGIVTAYEISQLDLSHTRLLVLSACETALGDIRGSEGVFGLQRAFKMAGVKKMILSLWQVPDRETSELMSVFYQYWLQGNEIAKALQMAQSDMRRKYTAYYWAGFVLIE